MRSGLIISAVGHTVLSALLLASTPALLQATDTQAISVDLVPADQLGRPDAGSATDKPQGLPAPQQPSAAPAKMASATDTLIRAPHLADAPKAPAKTAPERSARAEGGRGDPAGTSPGGAAAMPMPQLDLPSAQAAEAGSPVPPRGKSADMSILPTRAAPQEPPPGGGATAPDASDASGQQASAASAPAQAPAAAEHRADPNWYAVLQDMPVIVAGEPPPPASDSARAQVATFKERLKKCWKLKPAGGADVAAVFRVFLRQDGGLAKEPMLLIAPPPSAGLALVQAAMRALKQCQPYGLPAADYKDWKVLDLRLSTVEMAGG